MFLNLACLYFHDDTRNERNVLNNLMAISTRPCSVSVHPVPNDIFWILFRKRGHKHG